MSTTKNVGKIKNEWATKRKQKWVENNYDSYRKSCALSNIRTSLKKKFITKDEIKLLLEKE